MSKQHRFERFARFVRTFLFKGSNLTFLAIGSTACKDILFLLLDKDILLLEVVSITSVAQASYRRFGE